MEPRKTYDDVTIGERQFRLRMMDARTGTWLYSILTAKASPNGDNVKMMQLLTAFHTLPKEEFDRVQTEALKRIFLLEVKDGNEFESAIMAPNKSGALSFKWLEDEVTTLFQLTDMEVVLNISPFFTDEPLSSGSPSQ
jgi:hypothetical protein